MLQTQAKTEIPKMSQLEKDWLAYKERDANPLLSKK